VVDYASYPLVFQTTLCMISIIEMRVGTKDRYSEMDKHKNIVEI